MAFYILIGIGGFLVILGTLILIIDALRTRWPWGAAIATLVVLISLAYVLHQVPYHFRIFLALALVETCVCIAFMIRHWTRASHGALLQLLSVPLLVTCFFLPLPRGIKAATGVELGDPLANAMSRTRSAITKMQKARHGDTPVKIAAPRPLVAGSKIIPATQTAAPAPGAKPAPAAPLTIQQQWAANRKKFKDLAVQFDALKTKRTQLPKADPATIHAFNTEATNYATNLAEARNEQEKLLSLQKKR